MNYTEVVTKLVRELTQNNALFTANDITRLVRFKNPQAAVSSDAINATVQSLFLNSGYFSSYRRYTGTYGNTLNASSYVYYNPAVSQHTDYNPDTLDPRNLSGTPNHTVRPTGVVVDKPASTKVYAVKLRGKNVWRRCRTTSDKRGSTTTFAEAALYTNNKSALPLFNTSTDTSKWEVVQYELTYRPV